jgi:hypothetical protein
LIAISGNLPPVSHKRMFNAVLDRKNFGGQRSQPTMAAAKEPAMKKNIETLRTLFAASRLAGRKILGGSESRAQAIVLETTNDALVAFLRGYRWLETDYKEHERPTDINLQIEFLQKEKHEIEDWLIVAPQRRDSFGPPLKVERVGDMTVKQRKRSEEGRGFQVFGEPVHRTIADFLAGIATEKAGLAEPNEETRALKNNHRGILLLYPVRENESRMISIGFELFFPKNNIPFELGFRVRRKTGEIVVPSAASD